MPILADISRAKVSAPMPKKKKKTKVSYKMPFDIFS